jgi:hypothetical protein
MAFADYHSQPTKGTLVDVYGHQKFPCWQSWQSWNDQYQRQSSQHHDQQHPPHRNKDWRVQHSADISQHQSSAPAHLSPVVPGTLPLPGQPPEPRYLLRSFNQDQDDKGAQVLHQYGSDHPQSTLAGPVSQASCDPQHNTQPSDDSSPRDLTSLHPPQHDERDNKHESALVGNRSPPPDLCIDSGYDTQTLGKLDQISGKRLRATVACDHCRRRKVKCDEGNPCFVCKEQGLFCKYDGLPPAIPKKDIKKTDLMLVEIRDMVRELRDQKSSGSQRMGRQEDKCDLGGPAMSAEIPRPRRLSLLPHEEVDQWGDARADILAGFVNHDESVPNHVLSTNMEHCGYDPSGGRPEVYSTRQQPYGVERRNSTNNSPPDTATAEALYESYIQHMHIQQPFLDKGEARNSLDEFIAWRGIPIQSSVTADHYATASGRPIKRRRHDDRSNVPPSRQLRPARLLRHALVYLIFALGEICMCPGPLPADSSPNERSGMPPSSQGRVQEAESSPLVFDNADAVSLASSQTPSVDGEQRGNDDLVTRKVPGLIYYVKATEILGGQVDGNSLVHAHIFLLAGLFKGQLARPKESMSWYAMAGRVLRQLLRDERLCDRTYWTWVSDNGQALKEKSERFITNEYQNSIVLASWACVDLESDISAELDLPSSGIVSIEDRLLMPLVFPGISGGCEDTSQRTETLLRFTSQVYLRKQLNQVHRQLHGLGCEELSLIEVQCTLRNHEATIGTWQRGLPASMSWDLDDLPPTDILHAQSRAKYWSLRYLINRPFLDFVLHIKPHPRFGADRTASNSHGKPRHEAEFPLFRAISEMSAEEVQIGYETCIKAAEKSTTAFDSVLGRLIVTNIHGTAHA